ncbi:MAG: hypothetical protein KA807_00470 [Prolixibacteraceae bacterium]|nr:hypothetical protein [Prolixibacteraceae bacterium]
MKPNSFLPVKIIAIILVLLLLLYSKSRVNAQTIVSYDCANFVGNEVQLPVKKCIEGIKASPITRGSGIKPYPREGVFNSNIWSIKPMIELNDYLEFTLTPDCGKILKIKYIEMRHIRSPKGPKWFSVRTSYDSFASDLNGIIIKTDKLDLITSYFNNLTLETDNPLTIRIYAYYADLEVGLWGIGGYGGSDLVVTGTVKSKPFIINEVDIDTYGYDNEEFVEIYDGGCGSKSLDGHLLVFYDGSTNKSYRTIDLSGNSTDGNGYFVVGNENSSYSNLPVFSSTDNIKNGSHAIAIYKGKPEDFPDGTDVDTINLVDALVYKNNTPEPAGLAILLKKGEVIKDENSTGRSNEYSLQRIGDGSGGERRTNSIIPAFPTPGLKNYDAVWTGDSDKKWENGLNWTPNLITPDQNAKVFISGGLTSYPSTETIQQTDKIVIDDGARINNQENIISNEVSVIHKIIYSNQTPDHWQYFTPVIKNIRVADLLSQNSRNDLWIAKYDNSISGEINNCWNFDFQPESELENISGYAVASVYDESEEGKEKTTPWQTIIMSGLPIDAENPISVSLKEGWNLIGNPYLTSIDWFDHQNIDYTFIQGKAAYKYNPSTDSYITLISDENGSGIVLPEGNDQYISSGQGYFLNSISENTFNLNPGCRADASTMFLKSSKLEDYIKLVVNDGKSSDETLISMSDNVSDGYDNCDAEKFLSSNIENVQIYSTIEGGKKLVFNAIKSIQSEINISINSKPGMELKLKVEGNLKNHKVENIIVKDIIKEEERNIKVDECIDFKMPDNQCQLKLSISFNELKTNTFSNKHNEYDPVIKYSGGILYFISEKRYPSKILISDYLGRKVLSSYINCNEISFPVNLNSGIYIVTFINNDFVVSKKISITK